MEMTMSRFRAKDIAYIAVFTALIAVGAWIAIPTPVRIDFTLQTLGVFLAIGILGGRRGTLAITAYLLLGAVGAPVFSGFAGGLSALVSPSGGYLIGFFFRPERYLPGKCGFNNRFALYGSVYPGRCKNYV